MKDDYTTNSYYLTYAFSQFKRLGEYTFWTWEWKGKEVSAWTQIKISQHVQHSIIKVFVWSK